ncbi:glycoside hydrolase family 3 protein [Flavobacterium pectinovorum]|uniref:glycoside hydrolase family 3 protein n=1 Tax=Flavobacterium pectinovorum TaxID=29533 RepID=UPI001FADA5FA|nr:glycoside hydrolase family 3 N-terminal domain-containing protein [Flavobacterium pectinovorum]MCI9844722.1 glycoside hydrolase family 3 C-terminal domain-containing protein [Flavobacterium pectinovorum]
MKKIIITAGFAFFISVTMQAQQGNFTIVKNNKGADLGYSPESGIKILTVSGKKFKDLNKNGKLDKYEDWRLSADERAKDLASKMSVEQIAGLMLYSRHQALPAGVSGYNAGTYNGKIFPESNAKASDLTDQQKAFLKEDNLRHVLITKVQSPEVAALWNNQMQAFVEGIGLGIPSNTSTDPRHTANVTSEFNGGAGGEISMWPDGLGMASTFDPKIVEQFGQIAAKEYRALGIATALSPQIDLGSEPRWYRISMTFGESPALTRDMGRAYIDGFQTSYGKDEIKDGWGYKSVNAMVKHWPSGGAEEGGRDGHWAYGKFAVYPGNNLQQHIDPFVNGAFKLKGKTSKASAVMPYYTITFDQDKKYNENVANGYSKYIITDLLRDKYGYDGVVCTDWLVTGDEGKTPNLFAGKPWGVENLSINERHYKAIVAGVDQFGGNNDKKPVLAAYEMGIKEFGEPFMRARFERSAVRLLKNIFRVGLFENPYLNVAETKAIVGNPEFMKAGYDAQLKSVVLLKNKAAVLPVKEKKTVFIPKIYTASTKDWWGVASQPKLEYPVNLELVKKYYNVTDDPSKADFAIVFVTSPQSLEGGYDLNDRQNGSNGYVPISLQYGTYTAAEARAKSIAAGDQVIDPTITDRTYKNKTVTAANTMDLRTILDINEMMKGKPVIVSITASKPMIFNEFEKKVDGIVLNFGVSSQAVLDIISGKAEPSGLLPVQMPANMETVEKQFEDVPYDMIPHKDSEGNVYDFAYGLNWKGVIKDARTETYKKE